jgi:hypothetical protein
LQVKIWNKMEQVTVLVLFQCSLYPYYRILGNLIHTLRPKLKKEHFIARWSEKYEIKMN